MNLRELQLLVEMSKDEKQRFADFESISCRQQFVQGEVLHELVVLVHYDKKKLFFFCSNLVAEELVAAFEMTEIS